MGFVQAAGNRARLAGWTEVYDDAGNWIAPISGRPVADAGDNIPLLSANPNISLTLLAALQVRIDPAGQQSCMHAGDVALHGNPAAMFNEAHQPSRR
ncbi:hypothetical protein ACFVVU_22470 [Kitasatospora sp. NPDC057965]|uniref:hypothetical protein n=1 Tax=Kitasatospora sp. NPDC057965 TaxID=3346291 RepID=UPI0036DF4FC9